MDLGGVQVQFEPLMSCGRFLNLKTPLEILAIIGYLSIQFQRPLGSLTLAMVITHVGTLSAETPSKLSEVASGHWVIRL